MEGVDEKIIEVSKLTKRYKKAKEDAVNSISFDVSAGEFFAFLGPNGAGKTTTISILTTILSKTSGQVKIAGYDVDKEASQVRRRIGVIFQNPSLDLNLTAEENIRLHAVLYGIFAFAPRYSMMPKEYRKRVKKLSKVLGIERQIGKPVKGFSGGMKRKLEIVRSLMHNPKVLFLDEPTSGLDPASRKSLWEYLRQVRESEKTTIFLTTHYLEEAEEADRVAIIDRGEIVRIGTPSEIKKDLVKEYLILGSRTCKKLEGEIKKMGLTYEKVNGDYKVYPGKKSSQNVISSIKSKLTTLQVHSPSLEEAYLDIVEEKNGRN